MPSVESNNYAKVISKIGQVEREKGSSGLIVSAPSHGLMCLNT